MFSNYSKFRAFATLNNKEGMRDGFPFSAGLKINSGSVCPICLVSFVGDLHHKLVAWSLGIRTNCLGTLFFVAAFAVNCRSIQEHPATPCHTRSPLSSRVV